MRWQDKDFDYYDTRKTVNMYRFSKSFTTKYVSMIKWYVENIGE